MSTQTPRLELSRRLSMLSVAATVKGVNFDACKQRRARTVAGCRHDNNSGLDCIIDGFVQSDTVVVVLIAFIVCGP